jgi:hypothetical protein
LYSSKNIIRIIESRGMGWVRHAARRERNGTHAGFGGKTRRKETIMKTQM